MGDERDSRIKRFAPTAPSAHLIDLLHRGHNEHITFAHLKDGEWIQGANVPAVALQKWFPVIAGQLATDAYFSVNGMFQGAKSRSKWCSDLPGGSRTRDRLQWLTAAFVDLDTYTADLEVQECLDYIARMESEGSIPAASIWMRSGRGVWGFWILRDRDGDGPVRARDKLAHRFAEIQDKLATLLVDFQPDPSARDVSRVTRVPGSINSKSSTRVTFDARLDSATGKPIAYTLDELARALGIADASIRPLRSESPSHGSARHGRWGPGGKAKMNFRRLIRLKALRSPPGFRVGTRHNAAWLMAMWLRHMEPSRGLILVFVYTLLNSNCAQTDADGNPDPIGKHDAKDIVDGVLKAPRRRLNIRGQTIADRLDITPEEAEDLASMGDVPWPAASRFGLGAQKRMTPRRRAAAKRHAALKEIIATAGAWPTVRELQAALESRGDRVSIATITNDLKVLEIKNPRARKPKRNPPA